MKNLITIVHLWAFSFAVFHCSFAQTSYLFSSVEVESSTLPSSALAAYHRLQNNELVHDIRFIDLANLEDVQVNGNISLYLMDEPCGTLTYKAKKVEYDSAESYVWYGHIIRDEENECSSGELTLIRQNGIRYGSFTIDTRTYRIDDLGENYITLSEVSAPPANQTCGIKSACEGEPEIIEETTQITSGEDCNIDVVVLYDQEAFDKEPNMLSFIHQCINQTNDILHNSDAINGGHFIFKGSAFLSSQSFNSYHNSISNGMEIDLQDFSTNTVVNSYRGAPYYADIVLYLTGKDYTASGALGMTYIKPDWSATQGWVADNKNAYCFVNVNTAVSYFTFAHELGHVLGAGHGGDKDDPRPGIPHGHFFKKWIFFPFVDRTYMTAMSFSGNDKDPEQNLGSIRRIPYYSNPNVTYLNCNTGISGQRDNAHVIMGNKCAVADYETNPIPPFTVYISGNAKVCPCQVTILSKNINGGVAPFQESWYKSDDGINYVACTHAVLAGCDVGDLVFVKLVVTDANGTVRIAYRTIETSADPNHVPCPNRIGHSNPIDKNTKLTIYPNPVQNNLTVSLHYPQNVSGNILLYDNMGQEILRIYEGELDATYNSFELNAGNLRNGIYFCKYTSNNKVYTSSFMIQH